MIAALGIGLLGMFLLSAAPPDIAGQWSGEDWGQVVLEKTDDAEYTGTYSDTVEQAAGRDSTEMVAHRAALQRHVARRGRSLRRYFGLSG